MHIRDEKALLRQRIKERLDHLSPRDRLAESRSICRRILQSLPKNMPLTVCAYAAMPTEADLTMLIEDLLARTDCTVFLPRFNRSYFEFRRITDLADLTPGTFHVPEPPSDAPLLTLDTVTHALIPGLAFDRTGRRLGRGNGGFDRWLADLRNTNAQAIVWGIALECQLTDTVPFEAHDQLVDSVVTPRELIISSP